MAAITFTGDLTLRVGRHTFQVLHTPGHTPGQVAVYVPKERVVFTGDTVFSECQTWLMTSNVDQWLEALERIRAQVKPEHFAEDDRRTYLRMLETFTGGGLDELQASLEKYEEHEQELIRRAWASPPPRVDDEYVDGLVWKFRYEALQSELRGVRRKLGEAEQRGDRDQVALLVTEDRRLAMAVEQHKSLKGS